MSILAVIVCLLSYVCLPGGMTKAGLWKKILPKPTRVSSNTRNSYDQPHQRDHEPISIVTLFNNQNRVEYNEATAASRVVSDELPSYDEAIIKKY